MDTIAVSELRAHLMMVLERVRNGSTVKVTSHGKIIANLIPAETVRNSARKALQYLAKDAKIIDANGPFNDSWDVFS